LLGLNGRLNLPGWQWLFVLEGLPAIAIGLLVLRILPDGPSDAHWLDEGERALLNEHLAREDSHGGHRAADFRAAIFTPQTWLLTSIYFTMTLGTYCVSIWLPQLIKAALNLSDRKVTLLSAIPYAVAACGMIWFSWHSDRTQERRGHNAVALFTGAIGAAGAAFFHQPAIALIALSIVTLGIWSSMGPFWSMPPQMLSGSAAAGGIALINSFGNLGGFLGSYMMGAIKEHTGSFSAALWALAGFLVLGGILVLFVKPNSRNGRGFEPITR
jgi:ACS family tartrate transporter-like MFS transporter